jgi:hypothetical protein
VEQQFDNWLGSVNFIFIVSDCWNLQIVEGVGAALRIVLTCEHCIDLWALYWPVSIVLICEHCIDLWALYWPVSIVLTCEHCIDLWALYWSVSIVLTCEHCIHHSLRYQVHNLSPPQYQTDFFFRLPKLVPFLIYLPSKHSFCSQLAENVKFHSFLLGLKVKILNTLSPLAPI